MDTVDMLRMITKWFDLDGFGTDEAGRKQLVFDGDLVVIFDDEARRDGLWMSTELADIPSGDLKSILQLILKANVLAAELGDPVMTISGNRIVIQQFLSAESCTSETLKRSIERFLNMAESWKKRLSIGWDREANQSDATIRGSWNGVLQP